MSGPAPQEQQVTEAAAPVAATPAAAVAARVALPGLAPGAALSSGHVLALQRGAGNAAVSRMLARQPAATAPAPAGAGSAKDTPRTPGDPFALFTAAHPDLAKSVPAGEKSRIAANVTAWAEAMRLRKQMDELPENGPSDLVAKRRRLGRQYDAKAEICMRNDGVVIPMEAIISDDILLDPEKADPREVAVRARFYKELLAYPLRVAYGLRESNGEVALDLKKYAWGPNDWPLTLIGGKVTFTSVLAIQKWQLEYLAVSTRISLERLTGLERDLRALGGAPLDLTGKKVGEIYNPFWNTTVEVADEIGPRGGYADDNTGRSELYAALHGAKTARMVVKAPDGWLHLYALDSQLRTFVDFGDGTDGKAVLMGQPPVGTQQIINVEGIEFRPDAKGWSAPLDKNAVSSIEKFAIGAIFGDFWEEPGAEAVIGQIVIGCIPIVGQIADARDVAAGVAKLWQTGGKDGKLQTALAVVGFVPGLGDAVKSAAKSGKEGMLKAAKEAAPGAQKAWAGAVKNSGPTIASRLGLKLDREVMENLEKTIAKSLAGDREARKALGKTVSSAIDAAGGDASIVVRMAGGDWGAFTKLLKGVPDGAEAGAKMSAWRKAELAQLTEDLKTVHANPPRDVTTTIDPPEFKRTGTDDVTSDVDISFTGKDASFWSQQAKATLSTRYGTDYKSVQKLLDLDIFTDPTRMVAFQKIGGPAAQKAEAALVKEAELNTLAKMLREGSPEQAEALARQLGVDPSAIKARATELEAIAKDPKRRAAMELEIDALHAKMEQATDPARKAEFARQMAERQGMLNASAHGAYVTPGGVGVHVALRDAAFAVDTQAWLKMTPGMRYMAVLDDMAMLQHVLADAAGGFSAKSAKDMAKYADRLLIRAGQMGVDAGGAKAARGTFDLVQEILMVGRANPGALTEPQLIGHVHAGRDQLKTAMDEIAKGAKDAGTKMVDEAGNPVTRPPAAGAAEAVGDLGKAFGSMLSSLASWRVARILYTKATAGGGGQEAPAVTTPAPAPAPAPGVFAPNPPPPPM